MSDDGQIVTTTQVGVVRMLIGNGDVGQLAKNPSFAIVTGVGRQMKREIMTRRAEVGAGQQNGTGCLECILLRRSPFEFRFVATKKHCHGLGDVCEVVEALPGDLK